MNHKAIEFSILVATRSRKLKVGWHMGMHVVLTGKISDMDNYLSLICDHFSQFDGANYYYLRHAQGGLGRTIAVSSPGYGRMHIFPPTLIDGFLRIWVYTIGYRDRPNYAR